jgi:O-antigen ligase
MPSANRISSIDWQAPFARSVRPAAWVAAAILSLSMVALNHDFDVIAGRFEQTVTSGAQLHLQEQSQTQVTGGALLRKLGLAGLFAAGAIAFLLPAAGTQLRVGPVALLFAALLTWTAASLVWSADPTRTTHELIRLFAYVFTSLILVARFRIHELVLVFFVVSVVAIGADVAADLAAGTFRPWESDFRMGGALHPNHVGRLGAIVAMIAFAATWQPKYRAIGWMFFTAGVVVVLMSVSRSALIGLLAGLAAIVLLGMSGRRFAVSALVVTVALAIGLGAYAVCPPSLQMRLTGAALMGRVEDASSLTGRWPLWVEMWRDGANRRIQGYGYGAYWTVDRNHDLASIIEWYPTHSHSVYMELLIDLGLVGLLLCLALTLVSVVQYSRLVAATGRWEFRLLGALLVCGLANGFFEVSFVWPRLEGMFLGMAVLALVLHPEANPQAVGRESEERHLLTYSPSHLLT